MKKPIVEIKRAKEDWILGLVKMGIIEVTDDGIKTKENRPHTPGSN